MDEFLVAIRSLEIPEVTGFTVEFLIDSISRSHTFYYASFIFELS